MAKDAKDKKFEELFRKRLAGHEEAPPPMAWEQIAPKIGKNGVPYWRYGLPLLLLLLISFGSWYWIGAPTKDQYIQSNLSEHSTNYKRNEGSIPNKKTTKTTSSTINSDSNTSSNKVNGSSADKKSKKATTIKDVAQNTILKDAIVNQQGKTLSAHLNTGDRKNTLAFFSAIRQRIDGIHPLILHLNRVDINLLPKGNENFRLGIDPLPPFNYKRSYRLERGR